MLGWYYILDRSTNPPTERPVEFAEWAAWMEQSFSNDPAEAEERMNRTRLIGRDTVGELLVSTVFLGLNHNWSGLGRPVLYETMVFRNVEPFENAEALDYQWRWSTWDEAYEGHKSVLSLVANGMLPTVVLD